jgi:4-amino-4-deoxy-L-arabinose transferase-like glycosyltransferase
VSSPFAEQVNVTPTSSARARRPLWLDAAALVALALFVFFANLWRYGLWEPDEARYAEIAREMLTGGNFIVPHLNYVAYVEKPPLLYWLTSMSYLVLGVNEFAARVPVALSALVTALAAYYFALRTYGRRVAILAGAILVTTPLFAILAQVLTTDMTLTMLTTIASFALFLHRREGGRWCWIAYIAIALAILTKGPVGAILPIAAFVAFLVWQRDLSGAIARFHAVAGIVLIIVIAAPWFVALAIREPGYLDFYIVGEHLERAFVPDYSHSEAFYFYIPVIVAGMLPWSLMVPILTWRDSTPNPARRFCLVAAAVIIALFSIASAKLIPYILPAIPFLAILIADGLAACAWPEDAARAPRPPDSRILVESGVLLILMGIAAGAVALIAAHIRTPYVMAARPALYASAVIFIAWGVVATICFARRRATLGIASVVAAMTLALFAGNYARIETEPLRSYANLCRAVAAAAGDAPIICYHRYVQALPFYNRRRVILLGARTELDFGAKRDPGMLQWFWKKDEQLFDFWNQPGPKVVVLDAPDLERMKPQLEGFAIVGAEGRKLAIMKPAAGASK